MEKIESRQGKGETFLPASLKNTLWLQRVCMNYRVTLMLS